MKRYQSAARSRPIFGVPGNSLLAALVVFSSSLPSSTYALDFQASVWTRLEDGVSFPYIVLRDGDARILLPRTEGYSIAASPSELQLRQGQVEIGIRALDEPCSSALRKNDAGYLRAVSKPDSEVNGLSRLVSESSTEFADRGWSSQTFQYTYSVRGLVTNMWVAYVSTPTQGLRILVRTDPASFPRAKSGALEMIKRMRQIEKPVFDRQFSRAE